MRPVRSSGSEIERVLGKALWQIGLRYRKNNGHIFGKPDFTLRRLKIAIFADSEFWHGKNWKERKRDHKTNVEFWHAKIESNIRRDKLVNKVLRAEGWIVLRFWGREIKTRIDTCVEIVLAAIKSRS